MQIIPARYLNRGGRNDSLWLPFHLISQYLGLNCYSLVLNKRCMLTVDVAPSSGTEQGKEHYCSFLFYYQHVVFQHTNCPKFKMFSQRFSILLPACWQLCPYVLVKSSACLILTDPRKIRYMHLYSVSSIQYQGVLMAVQNDLLTDHANRYYFWYWWIWALSIFCLTLNLKNSALPGIFKRLLACLWKVKVQMLFQDKQQYSVAQANILNSLSQVLFEIVDILSFGSFENVHVCPKPNKMNTHGRINPPRIAAPFEPAWIFLRVVLDKRWKCFKSWNSRCHP